MAGVVAKKSRMFVMLYLIVRFTIVEQQMALPSDSLHAHMYTHTHTHTHTHILPKDGIYCSWINSAVVSDHQLPYTTITPIKGLTFHRALNMVAEHGQMCRCLKVIVLK